MPSTKRSASAFCTSLPGHKADVVSNGREVLDALGRKSYDILLLDVQMPEMDGLGRQARQICQRWPDAKRPRMIAMTGNALVGDREEVPLRSRNARLHRQTRARR